MGWPTDYSCGFPVTLLKLYYTPIKMFLRILYGSESCLLGPFDLLTPSNIFPRFFHIFFCVTRSTAVYITSGKRGRGKPNHQPCYLHIFIILELLWHKSETKKVKIVKYFWIFFFYFVSLQILSVQKKLHKLAIKPKQEQHFLNTFIWNNLAFQ